VTEGEWLACTDPQPMLGFLFHHPGYSERKMRLFAVACYWQVAEFHWDEPLFEAEIEAIELYADGLVGEDALVAVSLAHLRELFPDEEEPALHFVRSEGDYAVWIADWAAQRTRYAGDRSWPAGAAEAEQAGLLRDLFGNPFRPVAVGPSWLAWGDGTVVKLAQGIYDGRAFDRLPVLADALEEAGCDQADLLAHLRGPGPHVRGCWAVDLVLGKE
jgi:hypothetical protein